MNAKLRENETLELKRSTSELKEAIRKTVGKTSEKTTPKTTPKTCEVLLMLIKQNPQITKEEIARELNITVDGVKYHIKKLRNKGIIFWNGPAKGGSWEILASGDNG